MKNMKLITETWKRFVNEVEEPKPEGGEVVAEVKLSMDGMSSVLGFISPTSSEKNRGNYEKLKIGIVRAGIDKGLDKFDLYDRYYSSDKMFLEQIGVQLETIMKDVKELTLESVPRYGGLKLVEDKSLPPGNTPFVLRFEGGVFGDIFKEGYDKEYYQKTGKQPLYSTVGRQKMFLRCLREAINNTIKLESFSGKYIFESDEAFGTFINFDKQRDLNRI